MAVRLRDTMIHPGVRLVFVARKRVAGQSVRVHVLQALPVLDLNVILLEDVCPAREHAAQALVFHEPLPLVIRDQGEPASVQVNPKMLNRPDGGQALALIARVIALGSVAAPGCVCHNVLSSLVISLYEDGS
jgi:hypothetical protein